MECLNELWCDIKDYEGLYQASNKGNIRALGKMVFHNSGNFFQPICTIKPVLTNSGYHIVTLTKDKKQSKFLVHRIIATCFKKPVTGKDFVNHKDLVKTNNSECNLEWCTRSENIRHSLAARKITHKHTV